MRSSVTPGRALPAGDHRTGAWSYSRATRISASAVLDEIAAEIDGHLEHFRVKANGALCRCHGKATAFGCLAGSPGLGEARAGCQTGLSRRVDSSRQVAVGPEALGYGEVPARRATAAVAAPGSGIRGVVGALS